MPMKPQFITSAITSIDVIKEIQHFDQDCNCGYPNQFLQQISQAFMYNATNLGFTNTLDLCSNGHGSNGGNYDDQCKYNNNEFNI